MKTSWKIAWNAAVLVAAGMLVSPGSARAQLLDVTQSIYGMD